ncbi:hypothetical protein TanjilG_24985 [Lupinus angustifolius]|uniref:Hydroxyproline-rich glycoprotein family protein n=1 Tax=Lupinus angustifolius TaxID=3871 RepID=A0A1J7I6K9_LUPAN|nr:hypothetical protein TanjilG_24985 [Lupinus angustifolius]
MASVGFCGLKPMLFRRKMNATSSIEVLKRSPSSKKSSKSQNKESGESMELSFVGADQLILMVEIHKKIFAFRDIMDLAPCNSSASLREVVLKTLEDLHRLDPEIVPKDEVSKMKDKSIDQAMAYFCEALKSLGESWTMNNDWMEKLNIVFPSCKDKSNMRETMLVTLDCLIKLTSERFDSMEEDDLKKDFSPKASSFGKFIMRTSSFTDSNYSFGSSPNTPKSVLPELMKYSDSPRSSSGSSLLYSLRVQAVEKLNPIDVKRLSFHMSPTHIGHQNSKIEEEPTRQMEIDDDNMVRNTPARDTSEDLVFYLDTMEESDCTITHDDVKKTPKLQGIGEVEIPPLSPRPLQPQSPKLAQKPSPMQEESVPDPPPMIQTNTVPQPPPPPPKLSIMILTKTVPQPPPPPPKPQPITPFSQPNLAVSLPPPPSALNLQKSAIAVRTPPPPPPPPMSMGPGSSAVATPPPPPPPPMPMGPGSSAVATPPPPPPPSSMPIRSGAAVAAPPPPPPPGPLKGGSIPAPPPPVPRGIGGAGPPPPPPGAGRSLRPKATTKLKRSTQLGNLYRTLKGKLEGSNLKGKSSAAGRKGAVGGANTGGKGMADALAEMTKRSSYFLQIEEDVQKYTKQIIELRTAITNFKTKDMAELSKFHKDVESVLENLTDESQVLSRFEGFPTKKLEAIRMAAALYNKLNSIFTELQNWKVVTPVGQLLDKVERYFNKIKTELDALERTKDEETKKFKGHNIEFDFHILIKIKEAMVDVSSGCMELAIKEKRDDAAKKSDGPKKECAKLLWRAFQFAFRVYTFSGGHDDRADNLTRELAQEIQSDPNHP